MTTSKLRTKNAYERRRRFENVNKECFYLHET